MDFKELEYFSTIVKCGNLTHAARQLYVSQPTLSKFLQKLEEDLGLVLFQRGSRRLKLTYADEEPAEIEIHSEDGQEDET